MRSEKARPTPSSPLASMHDIFRAVPTFLAVVSAWIPSHIGITSHKISEGKIGRVYIGLGYTLVWASSHFCAMGIFDKIGLNKSYDRVKLKMSDKASHN